MKNLRHLALFMLLCLCGCDNGQEENLIICGPLKTNCDLVPDPGLCNAAFRKYYYDKAEGKCKEFMWGGCGGVVPFNTLEECVQCERTIAVQ